MTLEELKTQIDTLRIQRKELWKEIKRLCNLYYNRLWKLKK